ncbi:MAG: BrnT family toxin [Rubrobacter sp.]|nr:BrnT family toxin [Rubrobacter sp.]
MGKLLWHGVGREEVEQALKDFEGKVAGAYNKEGERREAWLGASDEGRILFVVYTHRGERLRPITFRGANDAEKRRYGRG